MNAHFCFSELLIFREKKFLGFLLTIVVLKINKRFSRNIEKIPYKRVAQKRYNFASDATYHTFFGSPCIDRV